MSFCYTITKEKIMNILKHYECEIKEIKGDIDKEEGYAIVFNDEIEITIRWHDKTSINVNGEICFDYERVYKELDKYFDRKENKSEYCSKPSWVEYRPPRMVGPYGYSERYIDKKTKKEYTKEEMQKILDKKYGYGRYRLC